MARRWNFRLPGVAAAVLVAVTVTVTGCGGSDDSPSVEEYRASVVETRDRVDSALARIQQATSEDDFLDRLEDTGTIIEDAADDFDDTGAPARFEDESERLVRHLQQLSEDLRGTADQARDLGFEKLLAGAVGLNFASWDKVNATLGELREQGVQVQPLRRH